jgi:hypothetical protein
MKPLYEIANEYLSLYQSHEDIDQEDFVNLIEKLDSEFDTKAINIAALLKNLTLDLESVEHVLDSLQSKRKQLDNKISYLKDYLLNNMKLLNKNEIKSGLHCIKLRKCPFKLNVLNQSEIPEEYKIHVDQVKLDSDKIREHIKNGVVIDGVELIQNISVVVK